MTSKQKPKGKCRLLSKKKLPIRVSQHDFNRYIKPFLRHPKKGPKPKCSSFKIFFSTFFIRVFSGNSFPFRVLKSIGPMSTSDTTDGVRTEAIRNCSNLPFLPLIGKACSISRYFMATARMSLPKKGREHRVLGTQTSEGREDACDSGESWIYSRSVHGASRECSRYSVV